ncbi:MAG TPA: hypothetical protein VIY54_00015 [Steroidobacteraceae bacterium]
MHRLLRLAGCIVAFAAAPITHADSYTDAVATFKAAGESGTFFHRCYGYVIFPNVGEGGLVVGGALGGGLMYAAAIGGQKFSYTPRHAR